MINNSRSLRDRTVPYCGVTINSRLSIADMTAAEKVGENLANYMIAKGALVIMEEARKQITSDI